MNVQRQSNISLSEVSMLGGGRSDWLRPAVSVITWFRGSKAPGSRCPGDGDVTVGVGGLAEAVTTTILAGDRCPRDNRTAGTVLMDVQRQSNILIEAQRIYVAIKRWPLSGMWILWNICVGYEISFRPPIFSLHCHFKGVYTLFFLNPLLPMNSIFVYDYIIKSDIKYCFIHIAEWVLHLHCKINLCSRLEIAIGDHR